MVDLAAGVKQRVGIPVITAGRLSGGALCERVLQAGQADLIGLARVLWADPEWPVKVREGREDAILHCDPDCGDTCTQLVIKGLPAFCVRWPRAKRQALKAMFI